MEIRGQRTSDVEGEKLEKEIFNIINLLMSGNKFFNKVLNFNSRVANDPLVKKSNIMVELNEQKVKKNYIKDASARSVVKKDKFYFFERLSNFLKNKVVEPAG